MKKNFSMGGQEKKICTSILYCRKGLQGFLPVAELYY